MRSTTYVGAACVAATLALASAASASSLTAVYSLDGSDGWSPYQVQGSGSATISTEQSNDGNGSLKLSSSGTGGKAGVLFGSATATGGSGLGSLSQLVSGAISFDFYKDGSNTAAGFHAPNIKLHVVNSDGFRSTLVWEPVYNGLGNLAADTWHSVDITNGNFWMYKKGPFGSGNINVFNNSLADWANGAAPAGISGSGFFGIGAYDYTLDGDSVVTGIEIGIGSGWTGDFVAYADNLLVDFDGGDTYNWDFAVIPLPAPVWMTLAGLVGIGVLRRRKV